MGWNLKADLKGPKGNIGPTGADGIPGVNAVANDTATAGYVSTAGTSATKTALLALLNRKRDPNLASTTLYSYGHSYSMYPNPYTSPEGGEYMERIRTRLGMGKGYFRGRSGTPLQDGISGALSPTLAPPIGLSGTRQWVPASRGIVLLQNYANEGAGTAAVTADYLKGWKHALRTFAALTGAKQVISSETATRSAGWTNLVTGNTRFWNDSTYFSAVVGSTITFSVTGDTCWVLAAVSAPEYPTGELEVLVNGVVLKTIVTVGEMAQFTSVYDSGLRNYTPTAFKVTGLNAAAGGVTGAKDVVVRVKTALTCFVSAVIVPMVAPPHVFVAYEPPRNPGTSGASNLAANDAAYRTAIDVVVAEFPNLHAVDLAVGWDNTKMVGSLDAANFHPNDLGHESIADNFIAAIRATITGPTDGVLTL